MFHKLKIWFSIQFFFYQISSNIYKRKECTTVGETDSKKSKKGEQIIFIYKNKFLLVVKKNITNLLPFFLSVEEKSCGSPSQQVYENDLASSQQAGLKYDFNTPKCNHSDKRHSMSISMSPGTPILEQGNPYQKLPDADKFAQGITEHLPFENLPDAVGTFEKMREVISDVQKKLNAIKNS